MPKNGGDMAEWVLGTIPKKQREIYDKLNDAAWSAVELWIKGDVQNAMNRINGISFEEEFLDN